MYITIAVLFIYNFLQTVFGYLQFVNDEMIPGRYLADIKSTLLL